MKENFRLHLTAGIVGHVIHEGESYLANDVAKDDIYYPHDRFPKTKAELTVPVFIKGNTVGAIDIQAESKGFFLDLDVQVIEIIASYVSAVIENLELHRRNRIQLEA